MIRRITETIQSALWWVFSLGLVVTLIGAVVMLLGDAPDWSIYRAGGYNPVVKISQ